MRETINEQYFPLSNNFTNESKNFLASMLDKNQHTRITMPALFHVLWLEQIKMLPNNEKFGLKSCSVKKIK
jgi:serine/threonine protein kinase